MQRTLRARAFDRPVDTGRKEAENGPQEIPMDYIILTSTSAQTMSSLVKEHMADGYELFGPPFARYSDLCQAMTRAEKVESPSPAGEGGRLGKS